MSDTTLQADEFAFTNFIDGSVQRVKVLDRVESNEYDSGVGYRVIQLSSPFVVKLLDARWLTRTPAEGGAK